MSSFPAKISSFLLQPVGTGRGNRLRGHMGRSFCARFGCSAAEPDRVLLATASEDKTARIWDAATGECVRILPGHKDEVLRVTWSPCGKLLVTGGAEGKAMVWRTTNDWRRTCTLEHGDGAQVYGCLFHEPHRAPHRLLIASNDTVAEWDVHTAQKLGSWQYGAIAQGGHVHGGDLRNPGGTVDVFDIAATDAVGGASLIAAALGDGTVRLMDRRCAARAVATLSGVRNDGGAAATGCAFSPTNSTGNSLLLGSCFMDGQLKLWEIRVSGDAGGRPLTSARRHEAPLYGCTFGTELFNGWNQARLVTDRPEWHSAAGNQESLGGYACAQPEETEHASLDNGCLPLITWSSDGSLCAWDAYNGRLLGQRVCQPGFPIYDVAIGSVAKHNDGAAEWIAVVGGKSGSRDAAASATEASGGTTATDTYTR